MIDLNMIAGPVIGAIIGYFTNNIAVKMLFRPLHPVKIGGHTLPFTPGLIPKGQGRLAKAIGKTVGEQLLTEDSLTKNLLSDDMKNKISEEVGDFLERQSKNTDSIHEVLQKYTTKERIEEKKDAVEEIIVDKIEHYLTEADLGKVFANEVLEQVHEYIRGTFLAMMVTDDLLIPITQRVETRVNEYIANDGMLYIASAISMEADQLLNQSILVYGEKLLDEKELIQNMSVSIYESFVKSKMTSIIQQMNLSKIVEDRINDMDVAEVEELVLSIMKKELNSVVNLGALIGFVIGIINAFI